MAQAGGSDAVILAGRYALSDHIAQGGMSMVWRGLDLRLHREVAIKILTRRDERDRDYVLREARLLASAPHPNVVQVLDVGIDDERPFIVMELLDGMGLDRILGRNAVSAIEALRIVSAALGGLTAVHARGIVHRDLKPSNLFLARDPGALDPVTHGVLAGRSLKILDFGVSRSTDTAAAMKSALTTRDGAIVGTPEYMAPEQARGLPDIGPAADLYALGTILFECLTQRLPFTSPNAGDLIIAIATVEPPSLANLRPDLPASLALLVHKALAKKPQDRFESAQAMKRSVDAVLGELEAGSEGASAPTAAREQRASAVTLDGRGVAGLAPTRSPVPRWILVLPLVGALITAFSVLIWRSLAAQPAEVAAARDPAPAAASVRPLVSVAAEHVALEARTPRTVSPPVSEAVDAGVAVAPRSVAEEMGTTPVSAHAPGRSSTTRGSGPAERTLPASTGERRSASPPPAEGPRRFRDLDY